MTHSTADSVRQHLRAGHVIPAHPLALTESRKLDERRQRALTRYYFDCGVGGVAVGVHTTQFEIRLPQFGLLRPVLELASRTIDESLAATPRMLVKIAGVVGETEQAVREAQLARDLGYDAALLSLGKLRHARDSLLVQHCRAVADVLPIVGFYLQPAVGGRPLAYAFWREFAEIPSVVAIKIAPFNRYQTLDVVRAVADSGRTDIALYTGNDDNIVNDLLTSFEFAGRRLRMVGGLLGHWAFWTRRAVELLGEIQRAAPGHASPNDVPLASSWLARATHVTDANAAVFDAANQFRGCITGIHEILRRQGLLAGAWCLNPEERLSPGQLQEIDRIYETYPWMNDDAFVAANLDRWMR